VTAGSSHDEIELKDIAAARERIAPHVYRTPLVRSAFLSKLCGGEVKLKLENQQRLNAFKIRGMINRVLTMTPEERRKGIVVASSGNHGIAAGYCGWKWGIEVEVFVPRSTPATKVERIKGYGVRLNLEGENYDDACARAKARWRETDKVFIDPSSDPVAVAGHGSIGFEIMEDDPDIDTLVVPVGGGGLVTGVSLAVKALRPGTMVYGVQSDASPAMTASLRDGVFYEVYPAGPSVCEGLVGGIGEIGYRYARRCIDEPVNVSERAVRRAIVALIREDKVVAEGSGAAGVAYLMEHPEAFRGRHVAIIISGGNLDFSVLAEEIRRGED